MTYFHPLACRLCGDYTFWPRYRHLGCRRYLPLCFGCYAKVVA